MIRIVGTETRAFRELGIAETCIGGSVVGVEFDVFVDCCLPQDILIGGWVCSIIVGAFAQ